MIAILVLLEHVCFLEAVLGAGFDHPAHVEAYDGHELVGTIDPVVGVAFGQATIVLGPAIFLTAPFEQQLVNGAQLHEEVLFQRSVGEASLFRAVRDLKRHDTARPAFLG